MIKKNRVLKDVKLAIDKALELNKFRMNYINRIFENWKKEGYPKKHASLPNYSSINLYKKYRELSFYNFESRNYNYDVL